MLPGHGPSPRSSSRAASPSPPSRSCARRVTSGSRPTTGRSRSPSSTTRSRARTSSSRSCMTRSTTPSSTPPATSSGAVCNVAVGFDNIDVPAATKRGVLVTNTPAVLTEATADLAMTLILAVTRRIGEGERLIRAREPWSWHMFMLLGSGLQGKTLGVVGMGAIGQSLARRAKAFGMEIVYSDARQAPAEVEQELGARRVELDELLRTADVVSIHAPLMDETRHLINAETLGLMKDSAYLVNSARGPIVDEAALVDALKAGPDRGRRPGRLRERARDPSRAWSTSTTSSSSPTSGRRRSRPGRRWACWRRRTRSSRSAANGRRRLVNPRGPGMMTGRAPDGRRPGRRVGAPPRRARCGSTSTPRARWSATSTSSRCWSRDLRCARAHVPGQPAAAGADVRADRRPGRPARALVTEDL